MKSTLVVLALLTLTVGLAGAATAEPLPGDGFGRCEVVWYSAGYVDGTGTDLDGRDIPFPGYECYW